MSEQFGIYGVSICLTFISFCAAWYRTYGHYTGNDPSVAPATDEVSSSADA
jgi:hypothetical protein